MSRVGYHEPVGDLTEATCDMHRTIVSLHASMLLEWIRRKDGAFSKELKAYLFTQKPITDK